MDASVSQWRERAREGEGETLQPDCGTVWKQNANALSSSPPHNRAFIQSGGAARGTPAVAQRELEGRATSARSAKNEATCKKIDCCPPKRTSSTHLSVVALSLSRSRSSARNANDTLTLTTI